MKLHITHVSPVQAGKIMGLVYLFSSLPFALLFFLSSPAPWGLLYLLLPVFNLVLGFIATAFAAWSYNLLANWVGGLEYTVDKAP